MKVTTGTTLRPTRRTFLLALGAAACGGAPAVNEVRLTRGAGGVGFLPLLVMERDHLIEKHAERAGIKDPKVDWRELGGPSVVNDALLSESVDFIAAGPPAFLSLWSATRGNLGVHGAAAIASLPMYLNTHAKHFQRLDDVTEQDRIAVTAPKVSIPSIVMQMYATKEYGLSKASRFDKYTRPMTHRDAATHLREKTGDITAHFASPPFHQIERKDSGIHTVLTSDKVMGGSTTFTMLSTTSAFRERTPGMYAAVLAALGEANEIIRADTRAAAALALGKPGKYSLTVDEMVGVLEHPTTTFTTAPQNVMKYAEFMHDIRKIKNRPASWKELFFPEIHAGGGS